MRYILTLLVVITISGSVHSQNVGIGTTNPSATLHVNGTVKITDGTQGANKVLTSDTTGATRWKSMPGVYSVANTAFFPNLNIEYGHAFTAGTGTPNVNGMSATLNLPDSVTLDSARFYFVDNSATENLTFIVRAHIHTALAFQILGTSTTSANATDVRITMLTLNHIVTNKIYSYDIDVRASNGNWNNLGVRSVVFYYHYF